MPSWRGGDLDRLVNARHGALHEALARRLAPLAGWESAAEVSFSIYGERGVIDRLAFHAQGRMLGVFELKADLTEAGGLVAQLDRYRRRAPIVARERGWQPRAVSCGAMLADTDTNRRRLALHETLPRSAFPLDRGALTRRLHDPEDAVAGLSFLAYPHLGNGTGSPGAVKRVRLRK